MLTSSLTWAVATSGAPAPDLDRNIVEVGDSLTYGTGSDSPGGATSPAAYLATALGMTFNSDVHNQGVPSRIADDLPDVDYLFDPTKQNILIIMIGTNDIFVASQLPAAVYAKILAYAAAQEAKGWRVILCTIPGNSVGNATTYGYAVDLNDLILGSGYTVADVGSDANIGTAVNGTGLSATYYTLDNLHLKNAGNQLIATYKSAAVLAAAPIGAPAIETSYGISRDSSLKVWFRDRNLVQPINGQAFSLNNLAKTLVEDTYANYSEASSAAPPLRVLNVANGHPAIRYSGGTDAGAADNIGYHTMPVLQLSSLITASSFYFQTVMIPRQFTTSGSPDRVNSGVWGSSVAHVGLYMKTPTTLVYEQNYDTEVHTSVSLDVPVIVGVRLNGSGVLTLEINGSVVDSKTGVANVSDLTENFRIGNSYFGTKVAKYDLLDFIIRNSGAANTDAAYAAARYL